MSGDGQRWRVLLAEGGRSFRIEVDTGAGFRLATVVEVDQALGSRGTFRGTPHPERGTFRHRSAEHPSGTRRSGAVELQVSPCAPSRRRSASGTQPLCAHWRTEASRFRSSRRTPAGPVVDSRRECP